jgi:Na+/H+ antiporter NhaD/arsenite permease-like protein
MHLILIIIFVVGYLCIAFEHNLGINKTAFALLTGILCWTVYFLGSNDITEPWLLLHDHLSDITSILLFLMGAMTIVELVDNHRGFQTITKRITTRNKVKLLWAISLLTFFMSAILDNLTTSIVMVSLLRKIIHTKEDIKFFGGVVVIAANAGGAWTPIGDITTTMLWIEGQITSWNIIKSLFIPSLLSMVVPLIFISTRMKGVFDKTSIQKPTDHIKDFDRRLIFGVGMAALIFVPIFKTFTGLPPFMGMLLGLAILWIVVEILQRKAPEEVTANFSVIRALQKIDVSSVFFFLGILLAIACLESTGQLGALSQLLSEKIGNNDLVIFITGIASSIIDNVPLVAAAQGMYPLPPLDPSLAVAGVEYFPTDSRIWEFLAYAAGTGGSMLIIGSAAGVAVMGMLKIDFVWYFKRITPWALLGYLVGAGAYLLINY